MVKVTRPHNAPATKLCLLEGPISCQYMALDIILLLCYKYVRQLDMHIFMLHFLHLLIIAAWQAEQAQ